MKFRLELPIQKPRTEVWKFFSNPENTKLWQPSLTKIELIRGVPGQPGAESKWTYLENEREFSLIESVLDCEEPSRFESQFENKFAGSTVNNIFVEQGNDATLWIVETTYKFRTLLMRIMGPVLKKNYVTRSRREMERFKEVIEKE
jgi:uncharacterized protein YndB with AHSA1/START domain